MHTLPEYALIGMRPPLFIGVRVCAFYLIFSILLNIVNALAKISMSGAAFYVGIRRMLPKMGLIGGKRLFKERIFPLKVEA